MRFLSILVLIAGAGSIDEKVRLAGYALMGIGLVGFVLSLVFGRGASRPQNPNSQPPPPRWGRNGSSK
jgi:hypothetical protein